MIVNSDILIKMFSDRLRQTYERNLIKRQTLPHLREGNKDEKIL